MKCPKCGTENNDTAKFCKNCGEKLGAGSSQDTSSQVKSSSVKSASEPKDNKKLLMISVTAIVCLIIIAGALFALNSSDNSGISSNANSALSVDSSDSSSGYYQFDYRGYTFNIPNTFSYYNDIDDEEYDIHTVLFKEDEVRQLMITVAEDCDSISDEDFEKRNAGSTPTTLGNINGLLNRTTEGDAVGESFVFRSGSDIIWVMVAYIDDPIDIAPIISSIQQNEVSHPGSSSSSDSMTYSEASSYLSGASSTVIQNTFDEADADGDGLLTGSEITKFKKLADLTERTADTSNTENVEAQDYGAGDGTTKTRYCTTHGRVAVGSDNLCPYCQEEGLDARTVKGSTEYI